MVEDNSDNKIIAEKSLQNNNDLIKLFSEVSLRQKDTYKDLVDQRTMPHLCCSFIDELLQQINGHTSKSYYFWKEKDRHLDGDEYKHYDFIYDPKKIKEEVGLFLKPKIQNQLVIDLGTGYEIAGYAIADSLHAGRYIGVEMNCAETANKRIKIIKGETPYIILQEDFGQFIRFFSKKNYKSNAIFLSGIDEHSYTGILPYNELLKDINNSLQDEGILVVGGNINRPIMEENMKQLDKVFRKNPIQIKGFSIYEKNNK